MKKILVVLIFVLSSKAQSLEMKKLDLLNEGLKVEKTIKKNKRLVFFWATWCKNCKKKLTEVFPKFKDSELEVITVNNDRSQKRVKHYIKKNKITLPVYQDKSRSLQKELKVFSVPAWAAYKKNLKDEWELVSSANAFEEKKVNEALAKEYF